MRKHGFLAVVVLLGIACSRGDIGKTPSGTSTKPQPPIPSKPGSTDSALEVKVCRSAESPTPAGLVTSEPPHEVRLYLDGSASMKPFAGQGDRFHTLLAALRPVLIDLKIRRSRVARVGSAVEVLDHVGGFESLDSPGFFSKPETNLAAVLDELGSAESAAVTIVVTDGVTSLLRDQGTQGDLGDCGRGSDVDCLTLKIGRLVAAGQGFWLVGLRSAFRGVLFSETLRVGGASLGRVDLPGRPFYVWVITDHPPTGRALVARLLERLATESDDQQAFALEFAPGDIPWSLPGEDEPASDGRLIPAAARAGAVRGRFVPADRGKAPLQQVVNRGLGGTAFGLNFTLNPTLLRTLPMSVATVLKYRSSYCLRWVGNPPRGTFRALASEEKSVLRLALLTRSFGSLGGKQATLVQQFERDPAAGGIPNWIGSWSTSDDSRVESGSRTLNLEEFVRALDERLDPKDRLEQPILRLDFE